MVFLISHAIAHVSFYDLNCMIIYPSGQCRYALEVFPHRSKYTVRGQGIYLGLILRGLAQQFTIVPCLCRVNDREYMEFIMYLRASLPNVKCQSNTMAYQETYKTEQYNNTE